MRKQILDSGPAPYVPVWDANGVLGTIDIHPSTLQTVRTPTRVRFCTLSGDYILTGDVDMVQTDTLTPKGWLSLKTLGTGWFATWYPEGIVDREMPRVATYRVTDDINETLRRGMFGVIAHPPEETIRQNTVWFSALNSTNLRLVGIRYQVPASAVAFAFPLHPRALGKGWWNLD